MRDVKRLALAVGTVSVVLVTFFHQGLTANPTSRLLTLPHLLSRLNPSLT